MLFLPWFHKFCEGVWGPFPGLWDQSIGGGLIQGSMGPIWCVSRGVRGHLGPIQGVGGSSEDIWEGEGTILGGSEAQLESIKGGQRPIPGLSTGARGSGGPFGAHQGGSKAHFGPIHSPVSHILGQS